MEPKKQTSNIIKNRNTNPFYSTEALVSTVHVHMSRNDGNYRSRGRWGPRSQPNNERNSRASREVSDDQALQALLASAEQHQEVKRRQAHSDRRRWDSGGSNGRRERGREEVPNRNRHDRRSDDRRGGEDRGYYQPKSKRDDDDYYQPQSNKRQRKSFDEEGNRFSSQDGGPQRAVSREEEIHNKDHTENEEEEPVVEKQKANFGLSGALANDEKTGNVYNGVTLKFSEPPEARIPITRWRLYVFKKSQNTGAKGSSNADQDGDLLEVLHISKQSAYLFGRERKVADVPVDHPSLSKQHCVLQYRALPDKNDRERALRCKPYMMDLGSTNGTFINGVRVDDARYYELRKGDVITLGASTREYVLLTENTTSADL